MIHSHVVAAAVAARSVRLALDESELGSFSVTPDFGFFPFMTLVQNMVGGLWALALYLLVAAWILSALAWVFGRVIHNSMMQSYSGTVFVWCALATMILGSVVVIVKFFATQALF